MKTNEVLLFALILFCLSSCKDEPILYKRQYSEAEQKVLADGLSSGVGFYQGSVNEQLHYAESGKYSHENGELNRSKGIAYLKRGYAAMAYAYDKKAADLDPEFCAGYMARNWLYFYRDYKTCLQEIDHLDTLTPNFVDYPSSVSIDYMRGVCYLQLGNIDTAIYYLDKHLKFEKENSGVEYVGVMPFQLLAIAYHKKGAFENAEKYFSEGIKYNANSADIHYYRAINFLASGKKSKAIEEYEIARSQYDRGIKNTLPYVEEFYAIYDKDLITLKKQLQL